MSKAWEFASHILLLLDRESSGVFQEDYEYFRRQLHNNTNKCGCVYLSPYKKTSWLKENAVFCINCWYKIN
jgi:hypothetical protein